MKTLLKNEMSHVSGGASAVLNPCCGVIKCYYDESKALVEGGSHATLCPKTSDATLAKGYKMLNSDSSDLIDTETAMTFLVNTCTVNSKIFKS